MTASSYERSASRARHQSPNSIYGRVLLTPDLPRIALHGYILPLHLVHGRIFPRTLGTQNSPPIPIYVRILR